MPLKVIYYVQQQRKAKITGWNVRMQSFGEDIPLLPPKLNYKDMMGGGEKL